MTEYTMTLRYQPFLLASEPLITPITFSPAIEADLLTCMQVSRLLGARSRATRARVGCVIWNPRRRAIVSTGFNGTTPGGDNTMEVDGVTSDRVIHAEVNALSKMWCWEGWGCWAVVSHSPCLDCAKRLVRSGIRKVFYLEYYGGGAGLTYLRSRGVDVTRLVE